MGEARNVMLFTCSSVSISDVSCDVEVPWDGRCISSSIWKRC